MNPNDLLVRARNHLEQAADYEATARVIIGDMSDDISDRDMQDRVDALPDAALLSGSHRRLMVEIDAFLKETTTK